MPVDTEKIKALAQRIRNAGYSGVREARKSLLNRERVRDRVLPVITSGTEPSRVLKTAWQQYRDPNSSSEKYIEDMQERVNDIRDKGERYDYELSEAEGDLRMAKQHEDAKRLYLGYPAKYGTMEPSPYQPTIGTADNPYQVNPLLNDEEFEYAVLPTWTSWKTGTPEYTVHGEQRIKDLGKTALIKDFPYLSDMTMSEGHDDKGHYISLYDIWDYNTSISGKPGDNIGRIVGGKPVEIYQRYYLDDWMDIPKESRGNHFLAPATITEYVDTGEDDYRKGGKIHIKPENRGKFTALKKRTGHSASWFKAHGTPAQKKMAVFALNARHWKHRYDLGGGLDEAEWPEQVGWTFPQNQTETVQVPYAIDVAPPAEPVGTMVSAQPRGMAVRPQTLAVSPQVGFGLLSYAFDAARNALKKENTYQGIAPSSLPGGQKSADSEALQNILLENGYDVGKKGADGYMGRDSITALQNMLVDAGYDIGSSGEAKNGVDGILGDKTRGAYAAWIKDGARIRKQKRDTRGATQPIAEAPQETVPTEAERRAIYNPAESGNSRVYSGIYNYGQIYNPKRDNLITSTGIDLSNITTNEDKRNRKVDTFSPYIFNDLEECKKESARNTLDCASHITYMNLDDARGFNIDRNGLRGDAWTMGDNVIKAGGHRLFDIFANEGAPSGKWNDATKQQTIDFVRTHAKDPEYTEFLSSNLQPGDVVELLYPGSKMFKKAYEDTDGKHQNTHIGYVVQVGDELYIRDNVGNHSTGTQSVNTRKLSSVLSGKERDGVLITGAVRVKDALGGKTQMAGRQGRDLSEFGIVPSGVDDARQDRLSNDAMYRAMGALNRNKEKVRKDNNLSIDEFNRIAGLAQAVILKESGAGELFNNQSWISNNAQLLPGLVNEENRNGIQLKRMIGHQLGAPVAFLASDLTRGAISGINSHLEPSVGLSSIKYAGPASRLTDKQRKQLGPEIKEALRESQPEASGVATFYALATSFHEVRNLLAKYAPENIKNNPDIQDQLTALAHNQGIEKIEETLQNAAADGDWDGHMDGLLKATYGKNAMLLRSYNTTDMYSKAERKEAEAQRQSEIADMAKKLSERGITAKAISAIKAGRESTRVTRANLLAQEGR